MEHLNNSADISGGAVMQENSFMSFPEDSKDPYKQNKTGMKSIL